MRPLRTTGEVWKGQCPPGAMYMHTSFRGKTSCTFRGKKTFLSFLPIWERTQWKNDEKKAKMHNKGRHHNCINKPGKALPRTNHLSIIAPSNKHADCKIGYTTISTTMTTLFACLSWKVHPPTAVKLYSPSDYWLTWLIKILPIMWQICQNLPTQKIEIWLLFVNLPTCTHLSDCFS